MIITKQKPMDEVLKLLKNYKKIFLVGCNLCATTCKTGGEAQLVNLETELKKNGKVIMGKVVLDPACNYLEVNRLCRNNKESIDSADVILSYACGGGAQALSEIINRKMVFSGNDTLFQGEISKMTLKEAEFVQKCSLCGECMLAETGGICPATRCPKGLLNGPCGGIKNGKCEVNSEMDCVWIDIYNRMKDLGLLENIKKVRKPKDYSKSKKPQKHTIK